MIFIYVFLIHVATTSIPVCTWSAKRPTIGSLQVVTNVGYATDKLRHRSVLSVPFDDAVLLIPADVFASQ